MLWSFVLAAVGITGLWIAGRGGPHAWIGWAVGVASQALWASYSIATWQLGFLFSCGAYGAVHILNLRRVRGDALRDLRRVRDALRRKARRQSPTSPERGLATVTHE